MKDDSRNKVIDMLAEAYIEKYRYPEDCYYVFDTIEKIIDNSDKFDDIYINITSGIRIIQEQTYKAGFLEAFNLFLYVLASERGNDNEK